MDGSKGMEGAINDIEGDAKMQKGEVYRMKNRLAVMGSWVFREIGFGELHWNGITDRWYALSGICRPYDIAVIHNLEIVPIWWQILGFFWISVYEDRAHLTNAQNCTEDKNEIYAPICPAVAVVNVKCIICYTWRWV